MSQAISPTALAEIEALYTAHANGGLDRFARAFGEFVERWGLRHAGHEADRKALHRCATRFHRAMGAVRQSRDRVVQLRDGGFAFWVYRVGDPMGCGAEHALLDGLVLPQDHPFWARYTPPSRPDCGCSIVGVRSEQGARRVGGDPDKSLPQWWDRDDPETGLPARTAWPFAGTAPPGTEVLLRWALQAPD